MALLLGFGGILAVFLLASLNAARLLSDMRVENKVLRDSSTSRSHVLTLVRSYIFLSHAYVADHLLDEDQRASKQEQKELQTAWYSMHSALSEYRATTLQERLLIDQLAALLDAHYQRVIRLMGSPRDERISLGAAFYGQEVVPLRTAVLQIAAGVENAEARQLASTESEIQREFETMGQALGWQLNIALGAALLLAAGSILYILRVERQNERRYLEILDARSELRRLSARVLATQEDERRSISRELHDEVGQTLSALLVETANLAKHIPEDDDVARGNLDAIRGLASSSINSLRDIALLLRPSMLDDLGLIPALEWQAREVSRRDSVAVRVLAEDVPDTLDDAVGTAIYRLVQEALHNVSAHAAAKHAVVKVCGHARDIDVTIEDDGAGFDPTRTRGLGLVGMEERVKQLGGTFEIHAELGKGTVLHAVLPTAAPAS